MRKWRKRTTAADAPMGPKAPNSTVLTGLSDHPDRGWLGEWLEYEQGNNPFEHSKDAMCDMWDEWECMRAVVAEERAKIN